MHGVNIKTSLSFNELVTTKVHNKDHQVFVMCSNEERLKLCKVKHEDVLELLPIQESMARPLVFLKQDIAKTLQTTIDSNCAHNQAIQQVVDKLREAKIFKENKQIAHLQASQGLEDNYYTKVAQDLLICYKSMNALPDLIQILNDQDSNIHRILDVAKDKDSLNLEHKILNNKKSSIEKVQKECVDIQIKMRQISHNKQKHDFINKIAVCMIAIGLLLSYLFRFMFFFLLQYLNQKIIETFYKTKHKIRKSIIKLY